MSQIHADTEGGSEVKAEELQAIRKRCEKATLGPWRFDTDDRDVWCRISGGSLPLMMTIAKEPEDEDRCLDFDFIAHARTDIPMLIDELHAETEKSFWQAKEIECLRGALERIERRSQEADRQFEEREGYPHRFDLSWWRGHADGLSKAAEIARLALAGDSHDN